MQENHEQQPVTGTAVTGSGGAADKRMGSGETADSLTTRQGHPVAFNQNVRTVGNRGPATLERTIRALRRTFPDLRLSVEEQAAEGDAVTTRLSFSGTDRGGFLWYPPTDRRVHFSATYTDRFSGGRLAEHDGGTDTDELLHKLGLREDG